MTQNLKLPLLIYGNQSISRDYINKHYSGKTVFYPLNELDPSELISNIFSYGIERKIFVITGFRANKENRELLSSIVENCKDVILFDTENSIREKDGAFVPATWAPWIKEFKNVGTMVNSGFDFDEKEFYECASYVKSQFKNNNVDISQEDSQYFVEKVGYKIDIIHREIEKLAITHSLINKEIIDNDVICYRKETLLYKINNSFKNRSYNDVVYAIESFMNSGFNENVIAEVLARKAKWNLVVAYLLYRDGNWNSVSSILNMNKVKMFDDQFIEMFKKESDSEKEVKTDSISSPFILNEIVQSFKILKVEPNRGKDYMKKLFFLEMDLYLKVLDSLKNIRYGDDPKSELYSMAKNIMDYRI